MIPRRFRLKRSVLFKKACTSGKVIGHTRYFTLLGLPRLYQSDTPTRFGFVISKKVCNRAVGRNKVRRRLREIVRLEVIYPFAERIKPYIAIVLLARRTITEASYQELRQALTDCLAKSKPEQGTESPTP